jgi:hypothetical protein
MVRPRPFCSTALVDNAMGDAPYRRRHENRAGVDVLPHNLPWRFFTKSSSSANHGLHRRLWCFRARSARRRSSTTPWAMPPTAGAMKIERGWMYYPTIYHGDFLLNHRHLGRRQPWPPPPPMGRPRPFRLMTRVDNTMGDTPYHRRY